MRHIQAILPDRPRVIEDRNGQRRKDG